jgi:hypothetical protein
MLCWPTIIRSLVQFIMSPRFRPYLPPFPANHSSSNPPTPNTPDSALSGSMSGPKPDRSKVLMQVQADDSARRLDSLTHRGRGTMLLSPGSLPLLPTSTCRSHHGELESCMSKSITMSMLIHRTGNTHQSCAIACTLAKQRLNLCMWESQTDHANMSKPAPRYQYQAVAHHRHLLGTAVPAAASSCVGWTALRCQSQPAAAAAVVGGVQVRGVLRGVRGVAAAPAG